MNFNYFLLVLRLIFFFIIIVYDTSLGGHAYPVDGVLATALEKQLHPLLGHTSSIGEDNLLPETTITLETILHWGDGVGVIGHQMYGGAVRGISGVKELPNGYVILCF